jgi:hypothetical protein
VSKRLRRKGWNSVLPATVPLGSSSSARALLGLAVARQRKAAAETRNSAVAQKVAVWQATRDAAKEGKLDA